MAAATGDRARKLELLGHLPLFAACSKKELGLVADLTTVSQLPAGTVLTREGAAGGLAFVIASGRAEVSRDGRLLATLAQGDVVGELSLIDGQPRSATVKALTDLEVLEIDGADLARLFKKAPTVLRKLLEALAGRLREIDAITASM